MMSQCRAKLQVDSRYRLIADHVSQHNGDIMKDKYQDVPQTLTAKKPAKAHLTDAAFRRRLKNIAEWRKKRLAKLRTKDTS